MQGTNFFTETNEYFNINPTDGASCVFAGFRLFFYSALNRYEKTLF
jgi:hypothetical protein